MKRLFILTILLVALMGFTSASAGTTNLKVDLDGDDYFDNIELIPTTPHTYKEEYTVETVYDIDVEIAGSYDYYTHKCVSYTCNASSSDADGNLYYYDLEGIYVTDLNKTDKYQELMLIFMDNRYANYWPSYIYILRYNGKTLDCIAESALNGNYASIKTGKNKNTLIICEPIGNCLGKPFVDRTYKIKNNTLILTKTDLDYKLSKVQALSTFNIYSDKSTSSKKVGTINKGQKFNVKKLSYNGKFAYVTKGNLKGWVDLTQFDAYKEWNLKDDGHYFIAYGEYWG